MSRIEEIQQAVERLPVSDFFRLAGWIDRRRQRLEVLHPSGDQTQGVVRHHNAFLNSDAPQDEGLYDDATAR